MLDWVHIFLEAFIGAITVAVTIFGMMWKWRREDRKERETIRAAAVERQNAQHVHNAKRINKLIHEQRERPAHIHMDWAKNKTGPLLIENLRLSPWSGDDDDDEL